MLLLLQPFLRASLATGVFVYRHARDGGTAWGKLLFPLATVANLKKGGEGIKPTDAVI